MLQFIRNFSSSLIPSYKRLPKRHVKNSHILQHHVKKGKPVKYQLGDIAPKYIPKKAPTVPHYPFVRTVFKKSNRGLLGAQFPRFVGKNERRRQLKVNVQKSKLWSESLQRLLRIPTTPRVLRTITRSGGLDNYLIKNSHERIQELGPFGWKLRYLVLKRLEFRENPPHKDAPEVELANGDQVKIYFKDVKVDQIEKPLNIIVGRRKLLLKLMEWERKECEAFGEKYSVLKLQEKYGRVPATQIIERLAFLGYKFEDVSIDLNTHATISQISTEPSTTEEDTKTA